MFRSPKPARRGRHEKTTHNDVEMEDKSISGGSNHGPGARGAPGDTLVLRNEGRDNRSSQTRKEQTRTENALRKSMEDSRSRSGSNSSIDVTNWAATVNTPLPANHAFNAGQYDHFGQLAGLANQGPNHANGVQQNAADGQAIGQVQNAVADRPWSTKKKVIVGFVSVIGSGLLLAAVGSVIAFAVGAFNNNPCNDEDCPLKANDDSPEDEFIYGEKAFIDVLANDTGYDAETIKLIDADDGSNEKIKTVPEGIWAVEENKIIEKYYIVTFTPNPGVQSAPAAVEYTVDDADGNTSDSAKVTLKYKAMDTTAPPVTPVSPTTKTINNLIQNVHDGRAFDLEGLSGVADVYGLDIATLRLFNTSGDNVTTLTVDDEGTWTIADDKGKVSFTPDANFTSIPSAIQLTLADENGMRTNPFTVTPRPFSRTFTVNIYDHEGLPDVDFTMTPRGQGLVTREIFPLNQANMPPANAGEFPIDLTTLTLMGPAPLDGGMPNFNVSQGGKKLNVVGEGTWTVTEVRDNAGKVTNAKVTFESHADFVRWPSPVVYFVKDTEGYSSNRPAIIWINPDLGIAEEEIKNVHAMDDDSFWTKYSKDVLTAPNSSVTVDLTHVLVATHMLWNVTLNAIPMQYRDIITLKPRYTEEIYAAQLELWGMTHAMSIPDLKADTDLIDDDLTGLEEIPLGTRLVRLAFIRRLVADVLDG